MIKKTSLRKRLVMMSLAIMTILCLTLSVSASGGDTGTMSSALSDITTALNGVIGYLTSVTSALLGNDLWLLGMGFFVLLFIAGFVMYLFRVGRR